MRKRKLFIIRRSVALQEWKGKDYADIKRGAVGRFFKVGDAVVRNAEKTHFQAIFILVHLGLYRRQAAKVHLRMKIA